MLGVFQGDFALERPIFHSDLDLSESSGFR